MIDREKVIKGLEVCSTVEYFAPCPTECPYQDPGVICYGTARLMQDALALLREQETSFVLEPDRTNHYHCTACGYVTGVIARMHKFCPECGRRAK